MYSCIIQDSPDFNRRIVKTYIPRNKLNLRILIELSPLIFPSKSHTGVSKKTLGWLLGRVLPLKPNNGEPGTKSLNF